MITTSLEVVDGGESRILVPFGVCLEIDLPATGGASYGWKLKNKPGPVLEKTGHSSDLVFNSPGSPSKERYLFEPLKSGEVDLVFVYKRPWEETVIKTAIVHVMVPKKARKR